MLSSDFWDCVSVIQYIVRTTANEKRGGRDASYLGEGQDKSPPSINQYQNSPPFN